MKRVFWIILVVFLLVPVYGQAGCSIIYGKEYGDCGNASAHQQSLSFYGLKGIISVSKSKAEKGNIAGAKVLPGGKLFFSGVSMGDIVVSKGGKLIVTGVVNGVVRNNGGIVNIGGTVNSIVINGGKTVISGVVSSISGTGNIIYEHGSVVGYSNVVRTK